MTDNCVKHTFEYAEGYCRTCGYPYCGPCLIYALGPKKPGYCLQCAIAAAGVRSNAAHAPLRSKAESRKMHKDKIRTEKLAAKATSQAKEIGRMAGTAPIHVGAGLPEHGPAEEEAAAPAPAKGGRLSRFRSS